MADSQDQEVKIVITARNLSKEEFSAARKQLLGLKDSTKEGSKEAKSFGDAIREAAKKSDVATLSVKQLAAGYIAGALSFQAITSAGRMFVGFLRESVQEAIASDTAQRKLDTALRAQSRSAPEASKQLAGLTREFQRSTLHSGGLLTEMEALLVQVGGVMPHQMGRALQAATDLAAGLGIDLRQATLLVAKAFAGEAGSLSRYGIQIDETRAKTDAAGAALDAIHARFGGQARSEAESYAGSVARAGNAWADLKQVVGEQILQDPKVEIGIRAITRALEDQDDQLDQNTISFNDFLLATLHYLSIEGAVEVALGEINDALKLAHKVNTDAAAAHDQWVESVTRGRAIGPVTAGLELFNKELDESEKKAKAAKAAAEAYQKRLAGLRDELSGRGGIQAVHDLREALAGLPPVSQLTREAHEKIIATLSKNAAAYDQLGARARKNLRQILGDTLALVEPTAKMGLPGFVPGTPIFHEGAQLEPIPGRGIPFGFGGFMPAGATHLGPEPAPGTSGLPGFLPGRILAPEPAPGRAGFFSGAFGGAGGFGSMLGGSALNAIMGGGNVGSAIAGSLGSAVTGHLAKVLTSGAGTAISGVMGGALNAVLPGIGALAGPLLGKLFGGLFGKSEDRKRTEAATAQIGEIQGQFVGQLGGQQNVAVYEKLFGGIMHTFGNKGEQGLKNVQADVEAFMQKVESLKSAAPQIQQLTDQAALFGQGLPERFQPFLEQMQQLGLIQGDQGFQWKAMEDAADRYGIKISGLGNKFQSAKLHDAAKQILTDYEMLTSNGANVGTVLAGMSDEISALVQDSVKFGVAIPANMKPMVDRLIETGRLVDANGKKMTDTSKIKYGEPIKAGLDDVVDRLDKLLEGLGIKLPEAVTAGIDAAVPEAARLKRAFEDAMKGIPERVRVDVDVNANVRTEYDAETKGRGGRTLRGAAAGGLFSKPTLRVIAEREPEIVGSPNVIVQSIATAMKQLGMAAGAESADARTIVIENSMTLDGEIIDRRTDRIVQKGLREGRYRVPERTVVRRVA